MHYIKKKNKNNLFEVDLILKKGDILNSDIID